MTSTSLRLFNTHIKIASQKRNTDLCNVRKLSPLHKKRLTPSPVSVLLCDIFSPYPFFFNQFTSDYETLVVFFHIFCNFALTIQKHIRMAQKQIFSNFPQTDVEVCSPRPTVNGRMLAGKALYFPQRTFFRPFRVDRCIVS